MVFGIDKMINVGEYVELIDQNDYDGEWKGPMLVAGSQDGLLFCVHSIKRDAYQTFYESEVKVVKKEENKN
jgi:hypothetical protein